MNQWTKCYAHDDTPYPRLSIPFLFPGKVRPGGTTRTRAGLIYLGSFGTGYLSIANQTINFFTISKAQ